MSEISKMEEEKTQTNSPSQSNSINNEMNDKIQVENSLDNSKLSSNDSEYDSADGDSDRENCKIEVRKSSHDQTESDTEGSVILERESGDGQESLPTKKVDDDEDKKNPQYIPKKGTFYEHDDRTAEDTEVTAATDVEKVEKDSKKKVWQDKKEKWSHDRFNDTEQAPKSRAELISIYGYDIRNEDGPPRARRRRRYGRGPNKYTRNWEDEDAYNKPTVTKVKKQKKLVDCKEEFPPLSSGDYSLENKYSESNEFNEPNISNEKKEDNSKLIERAEKYQSETSGNMSITATTTANENATKTNDVAFQDSHSNKSQQQRFGSGRVIKPNKKEIKDSDFKGFTTKSRQARYIKSDQKVVIKNQKKDDFIQTQNYTNRNNKIQELEKDMTKLNILDNQYSKSGSSKHNNNSRQGSVPPRLQAEQKGSKRYSSIRQRSLPETATPPFNQPTNYYPNEYNQQNQVSQQNLIHQNTQIHPSTTQVTQIAPPPLPSIPSVNATPILPFPQPPPPFLQPGVAPPTFIAQQAPPPILNYMSSQQQFSQAYQGYQQQFNQVTQPTEIYQPTGGITYYSTDQQVIQRTVPQKRPKAAIPIVAPPPPHTEYKIKEHESGSNIEIPGIVEENVEKSNLQESSVSVQ